MQEAQRNRLIAAGLVAAALVVASWASLMVLNAASYQKFTVTGDLETGDFCKQYTDSCRCYGSLQVRESFPPQYACDGIEICRPINRTVCP